MQSQHEREVRARATRTSNQNTQLGMSGARNGTPGHGGIGGYVREYGPGALVEGAVEGAKQAGKRILKEAPDVAPRAVRLGKGALGLPGKVFDAAELVTAQDKLRAGVGIAGGMAGGAALGAVGGFLGGPPGAIAGAAFGNAIGESGAEWLYDHRDGIARDASSLRDAAAHSVTNAITQGWGDTDPTVRKILFGPRY